MLLIRPNSHTQPALCDRNGRMVREPRQSAEIISFWVIYCALNSFAIQCAPCDVCHSPTIESKRKRDSNFVRMWNGESRNEHLSLRLIKIACDCGIVFYIVFEQASREKKRILNEFWIMHNLFLDDGSTKCVHSKVLPFSGPFCSLIEHFWLMIRNEWQPPLMENDNWHRKLTKYSMRWLARLLSLSYGISLPR